MTFGAGVVARGDVEIAAPAGADAAHPRRCDSHERSLGATTAPTAAAHEERARDLFRRLFDERDLTDPRWYWADGLVTRLHALDLTLRGPDGMADFFTSLFAAVPDFAMEVEAVDAHEDGATIRWRATGTFTGAPWVGIEPPAPGSTSPAST